MNGENLGKPCRPNDADPPPDGRGERPTDPNELAKWIVQQTTYDSGVQESPTDDETQGNHDS